MSPDAFLFVIIFIAIDAIYRFLLSRQTKNEKAPDYKRRNEQDGKYNREEYKPLPPSFPSPSKKSPLPLFRFPRFKRRSKRQQFLPKIQDIINEQLAYFDENLDIRKGVKLSSINIPLYRDKPRWLSLEGVICCFVDIQGSTKLSVKINKYELARIYRLFTEAAIDIFDELDSDYIDVKGDGVFALYDQSCPHKALAATIIFKTYVDTDFTREVRERINQEVQGHYGIAQADVLVRRLGKRESSINKNRQNAVWAGQPVNMSVKLAGLSSNSEIWMSPEFYNNLDEEKVASLEWKVMPVPKDIFGFNIAYVCSSNLSKSYGQKQSEELIKLDKIPGRTSIPALVKLLMDIWNQKIK